MSTIRREQDRFISGNRYVKPSKQPNWPHSWIWNNGTGKVKIIMSVSVVVEISFNILYPIILCFQFKDEIFNFLNRTHSINRTQVVLLMYHNIWNVVKLVFFLCKTSITGISTKCLYPVRTMLSVQIMNHPILWIENTTWTGYELLYIYIRQFSYEM